MEIILFMSFFYEKYHAYVVSPRNVSRSFGPPNYQQSKSLLGVCLVNISLSIYLFKNEITSDFSYIS